MQSATLFADPPIPQVAPTTAKPGFTLRDYQLEDCDEVCRLWDSGVLHVVCVWATGLGKSVFAAELAGRTPALKRALIVVDSLDLAIDLHRTTQNHLGVKAGMLTGDYKEDCDGDILIATKQCLCAGDRFRSLDPMEFDRVIVDEGEAALANEYLLMVSHFIDGNPDVKLVGCTATPLPAGDRKITDLFSYAAKEPGLLYRDLQWAYLNGWLVKPTQGVLRCSMDFSTLKVRKQDGGERDYSDKDIARLMLEQDERQWLELAGGIYQITKGKTAIVVCPNSTAVADTLAGYIEGHAREAGENGIAHAVHRSLGKKRSWDMMRRFKAGEYPVAVSCKMFEKGFDYDKVNMIVMVRRTQSLRLYTQIAGRGSRPLIGVRAALGSEPDPKERMRIIAESGKPNFVVVDCVGINDEAKDILGVIDILGRGVRDDIKERVRRMMLDRARAQMNERNNPVPESEAAGVDVGDSARAAVAEIRDELEREKRAALSAKVEVMYRLENGKESAAMKTPKPPKPKRGTSSLPQVRYLIAMGVLPDTALGYSKKQAGAVISRYKASGRRVNWRNVNEWEARNGQLIWK